MSEEASPTHTICPYCGVGCGVELDTESGLDLTGWHDNPVNDGSLCIKGMSADDIIEHEDRLTQPLIKDDNGEFREVSWEAALSRVVTEIEDIVEAYGPDAMAFFASSQLTNEVNYLYQKIARQLGTNNVDNCARLCHSSTVAALNQAVGRGAMTNSMDDLQEADVYWIQGANPAESHPVAFNNYFKQAASDGTFVIQIDPHENKTTRDADLHIANEPGTDIPLLNAVLKTILEEGWYDETFIEERTDGFDELREHLATVDRAAAAAKAGVDLDDLETAAKRYATADRAAIFTGMGMSQHRCGTDNVQNLINLALATGNFGEPGTGVNPLRGQNNVQGNSDVGGLPGVFPGYQSVDDPEARDHLADVWGFEPPAEPGLTHVEVAHEAGDQIHGAFVLGENPVMSEPNNDEIVAGFERMDFVVAQDVFMTETAELADVILPAASWAESYGTVTNTDRRVQLMRPIETVYENTRRDFEIINEIGDRLFDEHWSYDGPEDAFEELREAAPIYRGLTYDRIDPDGLRWPCYDEDDDGLEYLYEDSFATPSGNGQFRGIGHTPPAEEPSEEYPFILTTARIEQQFNTGAMSTRSDLLNRVAPENFVDIHPDDAEELGIEDGDDVRLRSPRGEIELTAQVTDATQPGVLWTTFHYSDAPVNKLTNDALDPVSKIPEYKAASASTGEVAVEPVETTMVAEAEDD